MAHLFALSEENRTFLARIARLALPIIIQDLMVHAALVLTSILIGGLGDSAITAVGVASRITFLFVNMCFGINTTAAALIGQFWGKGDIKNIHKAMGIAIMVGLIAATIFVSIIMFFAFDIMMFFTQGNAEVAVLGVAYLRLASWGYFAIALCQMLRFASQGIGQPKISVYSMGTMLITNTVLCFLFIRVMGHGVEGAGLAFLISRIVEAIAVVLATIMFKLPLVTKIRNYFAFDRCILKEYFKLGAPVMANEAIWSSGTALYTYVFAFTGPSGQAASQIVLVISDFFLVFGIAVSAGCGVLIANALGADKISYARRLSNKCMVVATVVTVVAALLMIALALPILSLYTISPEVHRLAFEMLLVAAAFAVPRVLTFAIFISVLRNGGDTLFCLLVDFLAVWCFALPLAWFFASTFGLSATVVTAIIFSEEIFKLVIVYKRMRGGKWARNLVKHV